jgi:hypothetical protein
VSISSCTHKGEKTLLVILSSQFLVHLQLVRTLVIFIGGAGNLSAISWVVGDLASLQVPGATRWPG